MEIAIMGYIGTPIGIHSFIPSEPKARLTEGVVKEVLLHLLLQCIVLLK